MKFTNAILSLATIGTINSLDNSNNNPVVVDAKSWSLRGLIGRSTNTNNNDVTRSLLKDVEGEEGRRGKNLPTPTANLEDLSVNQQGGGRRLKKKDEGGGKKGKNKGEEAAVVVEAEDGGDKKKKPKEGKKDEKIGKAVFEEAPADVKEQHAACDDTTGEEGEVGRRKLGGKGNKDKAVMESGVCQSCSKEEGDAAEVAASGLTVEVEASGDQTCNPDDMTCEEVSGAGEDGSGVGEDPTLVPPEEEDMTEEEAVERRELMERRLTGDTRNIGQFAPLACNPVEFDCTAAAGLSTVVGEGEVVVPCGTCLVVSGIIDGGDYDFFIQLRNCSVTYHNPSRIPTSLFTTV